MSFKVLYVEDDADYVDQVIKSVLQSAQRNAPRELEVVPVPNPDGLESALAEGCDLVLADVGFPTGPDGTDKPMLVEIVQIVRRWCDANELDALPVIAYTRRDKTDLVYCLNIDRDYGLYDVWDKATACPDYVAWRLGRIAMELARERSDGLLQQLVFAMRGGARWHMHVVEIAKQYRGGWNESDQIHRALTEIGAIGLAMGTSVQCKRLWSIMESWEFVGRALFRRSRGHARHVLNVFWLGYLLFHHPLLKERFREMWRNIVSSRMPTAHEEDPMEGLSDAWLYASLFHDVGGCFEKAAGTAQETARLLGQFRVLMAGDNEVEGATVEIRAELMAEARMIFEEMGAEATNVFLPIWQKSLDEKKYDHGVISAMLIRNLVTEGVQAEYAKEAARAMAIHNLIGELGETVTTVVRWEENPIGAMLLLCDQLQTWDRERGIERLADLDGSERAGLTGVNVESDFSGAICVTLGIDYLGQSHIARHPVYTRVRQNLEGILQDYPIRTLLRVGSPWPFVLRPKFWLMGRKLQTECEFK